LLKRNIQFLPNGTAPRAALAPFFPLPPPNLFRSTPLTFMGERVSSYLPTEINLSLENVGVESPLRSAYSIGTEMLELRRF
jgi:hypothetical protein